MSPKETRVFCFLDESGTPSIYSPTKYFALGAIVHPAPDDLNHRLYEVFMNLVGDCKKLRTEQEFHFTDVTKGTLRHFERCIEILEQDKWWRFFSVVLDLKDPLFIAPKNGLESWACYLRWAKILLQRNLKAHERAVVLADIFRRPKAGITHSFGTLPYVVPQAWDVLQVSSHGVLMIQMADLLLGASLYEGTSECKLALAERVRKMRAGMPRARFNEWRVRWDKK